MAYSQQVEYTEQTIDAKQSTNMATLISWIAVFVVFLMALFIFKRLLGLLFGPKKAKTPLPDELADAVEDIAGASRIAAALAAAATYFAAPAGLLAIAAAIGLAPKPLIVVLLPILLVIAFGAAALSAAAKLFAKSRRKRGRLSRE